jgi:hypothetical protein
LGSLGSKNDRYTGNEGRQKAHIELLIQRDNLREFRDAIIDMTRDDIKRWYSPLGYNLLTYAVTWKANKIVRYLLQVARMDVNAQDGRGKTVMDEIFDKATYESWEDWREEQAAEKWEVFKTLIDNGAMVGRVETDSDGFHRRRKNCRWATEEDGKKYIERFGCDQDARKAANRFLSVMNNTECREGERQRLHETYTDRCGEEVPSIEVAGNPFTSQRWTDSPADSV